MYDAREQVNLKSLLLDYLEGARPDYQSTELKIISSNPLTVSDSRGYCLRLNILDQQVNERLSGLNRHHSSRNWSLCLNTWKFVLKKIPG